MSLEGTATGKTLVGRINKCDVLTLSAYGIAVKHGFKGTEEQWLESLKPDGGYHAAQHAKGGKDPITPAMIGARPDSWMPTAAQVGAAPAGYGLGEVYGGQCDDCHDVSLRNGFYFLHDGTANYPTLIPISNNGVMFVESRGESKYHTVKFDAYKANCWYRGGAWSEWEYENPPMVIGTEYRTTERWNGKAVYTALVSMGNLPNTTTKSVSVPGDKVATNIVRFNAIATLSGKFAYDMMCLSGVTRVEFRYGTDSNVYMNVATNTDMSAYSGTFQLWYTKD